MVPVIVIIFGIIIIMTFISLVNEQVRSPRR